MTPDEQIAQVKQLRLDIAAARERIADLEKKATEGQVKWDELAAVLSSPSPPSSPSSP